MILSRNLRNYRKQQNMPQREYMHMLIALGKQTPILDDYLADLWKNEADPEEWLALIFAFQDAGRREDALHWLHLARERFPDHIMICYWGGVICQWANQWQDALAFWEQVLLLNPDFTDAAYGCAECQEKLGNWTAACKIWDSLVCRLEARELTAEADYPKKQARYCRSQLSCAYV